MLLLFFLSHRSEPPSQFESESETQAAAARPANAILPSRSRATPQPDPRGVKDLWATALTKTKDERLRRELSQLIQRADLSDLPGVLEWIEQLAPSELRFELRKVLFVRWARADGASAMFHVQNQIETERGPDLMAFGLTEWAKVNPAAAVRWFADAAQKQVQAQMTVALSGALATQSPDLLLQLMPAVMEEPVRTELCAAIVQSWKDNNPAGAADLILSMTSGPAQADLLAQLIPHWGEKDRRGALQWVQEMTAGALQNTALTHLSYDWVRSAPEEAAQYARTLPTGTDQFLITVTSQWGRLEPEAAVRWAQQLQDSDLKEKVLASLLAGWAQENPEAAANFVKKLAIGAGGRESAAISVVTAWAAKDPAAAAEWATSFPAGPQRDYAIENVFYQWALVDSVAAVSRLGRLPSSGERDTALYATAGSLVDTFPDLAVQWAAGVGNEPLRNRQTERAARAWLAVDPKAARAWIELSDLPVALKRQLLPRS
ncbi:MAG: hypothetical protein HZA93_17590 [Verrucomicrobia bacterium]|nr:hypothetical protein [Verrucomicrobiota bacterium]